MNSNAIQILSNPHRCDHMVYPYTEEAQLVEAVDLFASTGLRRGEAILLIMSSNHRVAIRERLRNSGFDLNALEFSGQLVCEDAESLLETFLFDGIIDELRFKTQIGVLIEKARASGNGHTRPVRVFGEMVDLIWTSNPKPTQRLEELWNEVIQAHSVPLLCAYSLTGPRPNALPDALLACHSHSVAC